MAGVETVGVGTLCMQMGWVDEGVLVMAGGRWGSVLHGCESGDYW